MKVVIIMMKYILTPNIPQDRVKTVVIDYRTDMDIVLTLNNMGIEVINTERCNELYEAINGHPDILIHHVGGNSIILAPNIYGKMALKFIKKGFAVTKGDAWLYRNYPQNIAYNVLRIGKYAFHNTKYTDKQICLLYEKMDIKLVHVKQGYTKCSVCVVNENAAITSDIKIAKALELCDIDTLLVKPDSIELLGLDYGFIGGASGLISRSEIVFTGCISELKDYTRIRKFLEEKGVKVILLSNKKIFDVGSIIPLTY